MSGNFYFTYVLQSLRDHKLYIGYSSNIRKRIKLHNLGRVKSTRERRPLRLIYYEACLSKEMAIRREKQLKTGYGRAYLKRRLKEVV